MTNSFSQKIKGRNRVGGKLRALKLFFGNKVNPTLKKWAKIKADKLRKKPYAKKRRGQTYERTGLLGESYEDKNPRPNTVQIINRARQGIKESYPVLVVGDHKGEGQAWMHIFRWWKATDVITDENPTPEGMITGELNKIIDE